MAAAPVQVHDLALDQPQRLERRDHATDGGSSHSEHPPQVALQHGLAGFLDDVEQVEAGSRQPQALEQAAREAQRAVIGALEIEKDPVHAERQREPTRRDDPVLSTRRADAPAPRVARPPRPPEPRPPAPKIECKLTNFNERRAGALGRREVPLGLASLSGTGKRVAGDNAAAGPGEAHRRLVLTKGRSLWCAALGPGYFFAAMAVRRP